MSRRRRELSADDHAAWNAVAGSVNRSPDASTAHRPPRDEKRGAAGFVANAGPSPPPMGRRRVAAGVLLDDPRPAPVGRPEAGLDRRTADRLRRGTRAPDARLDLHGMTAERAHAALSRFVAQARRQGFRCLLVITGKGGRSSRDDAPWLAQGRGVLRDAVPGWLRAGPHGRDIVGIYEAAPKHGGAGALYVYLKRSRTQHANP